MGSTPIASTKENSLETQVSWLFFCFDHTFDHTCNAVGFSSIGRLHYPS